ncbi:biotin--[acetyl-CoA-carboxylase] ligase [uncultured Bacteroides sp.]|uniref:biotin--[acetyl-CoA-carboxylase] ligase n=1 Tax=uncultured Bacteroides sp. TaxID=162156 RepID=UPI0025E21ADF|nr:biotin--[acetyl-CoA-carboxylase] ligase [uncultured Bacteroides sp.]
MTPCPDMKKEPNLIITPAVFPVPLIILPETDSTNNHLTQLCNEQQSAVREFTTIIAERQTAGKGQRGNSWESEDCRNITFSFVLYPTFVEARRQFVLSQIVSLSIKEELDEWTEGISIKWPNDIYWNEKKICGILIENDLSGHHIGRSISGIGVNINQETFRSNAPNPVSLKQITGQEYDRYLILANIMRRLKEYYSLLQTGTSGDAANHIAERYAHSLFRREGFHRYADADGEFLACLLRVEPDGRFILEDQTGKERGYLFKEVQYIL